MCVPAKTGIILYSFANMSPSWSLLIVGMQDKNYENPDVPASVKKSVLRLTGDKTLLIPGNFNASYNAFLRDFLSVSKEGFRAIFTPRRVPAAPYYKESPSPAPLPIKESRQSFFTHAFSDAALARQADGLVKAITYNALLLTLIAKQRFPDCLRRVPIVLRKHAAKDADFWHRRQI